MDKSKAKSRRKCNIKLVLKFFDQKKKSLSWYSRKWAAYIWSTIGRTTPTSLLHSLTKTDDSFGVLTRFGDPPNLRSNETHIRAHIENTDPHISCSVTDLENYLNKVKQFQYRDECSASTKSSSKHDLYQKVRDRHLIRSTQPTKYLYTGNIL